MKTIYLAGGCFWGVQKYFDLIPGVISTTVGYANGHIKILYMRMFVRKKAVMLKRSRLTMMKI